MENCVEHSFLPITTIAKRSACKDTKVWFLDPDVCDESVHEVQLAEDEVQQGAIVTDTGSDGLYSSNTCQSWNIITDENRVSYLSKKITIASSVSTLLYWWLIIMHFIIWSIYCNMFQCIVISVGNGGFYTQAGLNIVWFKDTNDTLGMKFNYLYQWQIYDFS